MVTNITIGYAYKVFLRIQIYREPYEHRDHTVHILLHKPRCIPPPIDRTPPSLSNIPHIPPRRSNQMDQMNYIIDNIIVIIPEIRNKGRKGRGK